MKSLTKNPAVLAFAAACALATIGCDRKEKVLDVETPGGNLEVERNKDTGEVDIQVETDGE